MPQPTTSEVHVDAILTNMSVAFIQNQNNFIAGQVFRSLPVEKQSDKYFIYTKGDWFRDEATTRAPATESSGSGYTLSTATYYCPVYAMHKDVDDQTRMNSDSPLAPDRDATEFVTQRMLLRKEIQWTDDFFTTSVWTTDKTGGTDFTKWSSYASSDPIEDVEAGKATILASTGMMPNTLVLGYDAYRQLRNHPDIIDRIKYTSSNTVDTDTIARLLGLERVLVSRAVKNTAAEGATVSMTTVAGKNALLCYVAPSAGVLTPTAGYSFEWRGVSDGMGQNVGISRFRMPELRADRIESQMAWDNKVISADLGYFFASCVA